MIDLVLQNSRVPALCVDEPGVPNFIEALNGHRIRTRDYCHEPRKAETSFKELAAWAITLNDAWIHDHMECYRPSGSNCQLFFRNVLQVFGTIFNDCDLQRESHLGSCETDARCVSHRFFHVPDELLYGLATKFFDRERRGSLPQYRISDLYDFQLQERPFLSNRISIPEIDMLW